MAGTRGSITFMGGPAASGKSTAVAKMDGVEVFSIDAHRDVYSRVDYAYQVHLEAAAIMDIIDSDLSPESRLRAGLDNTSVLMEAIRDFVEKYMDDSKRTDTYWRFNADALERAIPEYEVAVYAAIKRGAHVVCDNTHCKFSDMRKQIIRAQEHGLPCKFIMSKPRPLRWLLTRNIKRFWETGKYVPVAAIVAQMERFDELMDAFPGGFTKHAMNVYMLNHPE